MTIAISTGPHTHLDHLGVLAHLLNIPLIVSDPMHLEVCKKYYPSFQVECRDVSLDELSEMEFVLCSGKFWAASLVPLMTMVFGKHPQIVFCPHGNSDKGHSLKSHVPQEISLVYGEHMLDLLKQTGAVEKIERMVRTGNYRLAYYEKHREFYDELAKTEVFQSLQRDRPTLLYAPTWHEKENPTSFFYATSYLIEKLVKRFNILIKLHPFLEEDHPAAVQYIYGRYTGNPHVQILSTFPPIYPLLAKIDAYLGDFSSIGYDFLAFDRPLFFLQKGAGPLAECGSVIEGDPVEFLLSHWDDAYSEKRKKTYAYAFGNPISPGEILEGIKGGRTVR